MTTNPNKLEKISGNPIADHTRKLLEILDRNIAQSNKMHQAFLDLQESNLLSISSRAQSQKPNNASQSDNGTIFSKAQLQEFGTGLIANCFGPDFAVLDQRRTPRIPNGDLLMMDRVLEIEGTRGDLKSPASIISDFHISPDAWYLDQNTFPGVPLSILIEIALQPCGIISAYIGTSLVLPVELNTFRNLDGKLIFKAHTDLIGKTITNQARLVNTFSSGGMHIQKYAVSLSIGDAVFLECESSFGYFSEKAMQAQKGLGGSRSNATKAGQTSENSSCDIIGIASRNSSHFNFIDSFLYTENAGKHAQGLIVGSKKLSDDEWFYVCHFFQDPVMPGSLGLEAIMQGLWIIANQKKLMDGFKKPVFSFSNKTIFEWKYRGQVIPDNNSIDFEIHLNQASRNDSKVILSADADFWVDGKRIYEFKNISVEIKEGLL